MKNPVTPIFRMFDLDKAREFYLDWLGFKVDWEFQRAENFPQYWQISRDAIILHLTEHHGDCTPGGKILARVKDIKTFHQELTQKDYKYAKPGIDLLEWGAWIIAVGDPFGNRIDFFEEVQK